MHSKLAGRVPLADMVARTLDSARTKLAAAECKDGKSEKEKKLLDYEKKEHGHVPSVKEEEQEKKAGADMDFDKLAMALDAAGDLLIKEADSIENGGESKQGGEQLPTASPVGGKQPYKHDKSKHPVPTSSSSVSTKDNPGAATAMATNEGKKPGGAPYPAKGVLKTAADSVKDKVQAAKDGEKKDDKKDEKDTEKKAASEAVDYILGKVAEIRGGGETLDDKSAPVPSNPGRQLISSNKAVTDATRAQAKAPRKAELAQVLTEPAMTRSTDSKVHENLRNASKGGVKIAAAKVLLEKIAAEGCTCDKKGECRYCKMKAVLDKKKAESK